MSGSRFTAIQAAVDKGCRRSPRPACSRRLGRAWLRPPPPSTDFPATLVPSRAWRPPSALAPPFREARLTTAARIRRCCLPRGGGHREADGGHRALVDRRKPVWRNLGAAAAGWGPGRPDRVSIRQLDGCIPGPSSEPRGHSIVKQISVSPADTSLFHVTAQWGDATTWRALTKANPAVLIQVGVIDARIYRVTTITVSDWDPASRAARCTRQSPTE